MPALETDNVADPCDFLGSCARTEALFIEIARRSLANRSIRKTAPLILVRNRLLSPVVFVYEIERFFCGTAAFLPHVLCASCTMCELHPGAKEATPLLCRIRGQAHSGIEIVVLLGDVHLDEPDFRKLTLVKSLLWR